MPGDNDIRYPATRPSKAITAEYHHADDVHTTDPEEGVIAPIANSLTSSSGSNNTSQSSGWSFKRFFNQFMGTGSEDPKKKPLLFSESDADDEASQASTSQLSTSNEAPIQIKAPASPDSLSSVHEPSSPPKSAKLISDESNSAVSFPGENRQLHTPPLPPVQVFDPDNISETSLSLSSASSSDGGNSSASSLKDPGGQNEWVSPIDSNPTVVSNKKNRGWWAWIKRLAWGAADENTMINGVPIFTTTWLGQKQTNQDEELGDQQGTDSKKIFLALKKVKEPTRVVKDDDIELHLLNQSRLERMMPEKETIIRGIVGLMEFVSTTSTAWILSNWFVGLAHDQGYSDEVETTPVLTTLRLGVTFFGLTAGAMAAWGNYKLVAEADRYESDILDRRGIERITQPVGSRRAENLSRFIEYSLFASLAFSDFFITPFDIKNSRAALAGFSLGSLMLGGVGALAKRYYDDRYVEMLKNKYVNGLMPAVLTTSEVTANAARHSIRGMSMANLLINANIIPGYGNHRVMLTSATVATLIESSISCLRDIKPNLLPRFYYGFEILRESIIDALFCMVGVGFADGLYDVFSSELSYNPTAHRSDVSSFDLFYGLTFGISFVLSLAAHKAQQGTLDRFAERLPGNISQASNKAPSDEQIVQLKG